jgi:demethoxyubiquinone hydroxylase (CLK1/Coq7/Cat5 family)
MKRQPKKSRMGLGEREYMGKWMFNTGATATEIHPRPKTATAVTRDFEKFIENRIEKALKRIAKREAQQFREVLKSIFKPSVFPKNMGSTH